MTLTTLVASHSPVAGESPWSGTWCHDCSYSLGVWTQWPCPPLTDGAIVAPIEGGWAIGPKAGSR